MSTGDILIHIDETLNTEQQQQLENSLRAEAGVIAPRFNKPHLLLVAYDTTATRGANLLHAVQQQGLHARMVGL